MTGLARTFFAASAVVLRCLAWVPFWTAGGLNALANWCERRARPDGEQP